MISNKFYLYIREEKNKLGGQMKFQISFILLLFTFSVMLFVCGCDSVTDSKSNAITPPTLISPGDGDTAISLTPTFKWNGTADKLQVDNNSTFNNPISADVSGTEYTMPSGKLMSHTKYFWRAGKTSSNTVYWSTVAYSFTTQ